MSKILVQLIVLLFAAALVSQQLVWPLFQASFFEQRQHWGYRYFASGTIDLLAEKLGNTSIEARPALFEQFKKRFGYRIELVKLNDLPLEQDAKTALLNGQLASSVSSQSVYKMLADQSAVLVLANMDDSASHIASPAQWRLMGTFHLLTSKLVQINQASWPDAVEQLAQRFDYPLSLTTINQTELNQTKRASLEQGQIVWLETEDSKSLEYPYDQAFILVPNSRYVLVIGPVAATVIKQFLPIYVLYFLVLSIVILLPLCLWSWPTVRGLNRLSKATVNFGQGQWDVRCDPVKASFINNFVNTFNAMTSKISNLVNANKLLVNAVSHELRTPLSTIEFELEMARTAKDPNKHHDRIESSVEALKGLVNEMLEYAKFERQAASLNFESVNLATWLKKAVPLWSGHGTTVCVELTGPDTDVDATLDLFYMDRAISNLVRNALRYADKQVVVEYGVDKSGVFIRVSDDGAGIEVQDRELVFDAFVRLDKSRNRDSGGTGLGLAIVKQIAGWHQGQVVVTESAWGGAMFSFSWPTKLAQLEQV